VDSDREHLVLEPEIRVARHSQSFGIEWVNRLGFVDGFVFVNHLGDLLRRSGECAAKSRRIHRWA
jgi:hypothetical protein